MAQGIGRGWQVDEAARAALIAPYDVPGATRGRDMADLADFAAELLGAPLATVTVMDDEYQHFLAAHGVDLPGSPRDVSFCTHFMADREVAVVPDAAADPRFAANPYVTGEFGLRFYAGAPLVTPEGETLGSVCVYDTTPRDGVTTLQRHGLELLARTAMARLTDRRATREVEELRERERERLAASEQRFRTLADTMPQMVWSTLPDGYHDYYNARWYEFTGVPAGSTDGEAWNGMFHPDDQERAWATWRHSLTTGEPYQIEYRLRHFDGGYRWVLGRALPIRNDEGTITRWFGTCTDIHAQKVAADEREVIAQELSHRIKNIFSVIAGLIGFAARARPEMRDAAGDLRDRITALGRAHDFVRPHSRDSLPALSQDSLHGLLGQLFAPYARADGTGVTVTGDDMPVDDRAATPLALLFHELATNAAKYGGLSTETGRVVLDIRRDGIGAADSVALHWIEAGGPTVTAPEKSGFGTQLLEMSAVRQLGGTIDRDWRPEGLAMTITVPAGAFSRG